MARPLLPVAQRQDGEGVPASVLDVSLISLSKALPSGPEPTHWPGAQSLLTKPPFQEAENPAVSLIG